MNTDRNEAVESEAGAGFVAVIGMGARFPDAPDVAAYWHNLCAGVESISMVPAGLGDDRAVLPFGVLQDADSFDAGFFGYTPAEALILDPQQRVFLEVAYTALEDAGYDPATYPGEIGVYSGASATDYLRALRENGAELPPVSDAQLRVANLNDLLASRAAHKLRLRGPAITVQTACSSALVAIHMGAQALLAGECDMVIAGGAAVRFPSHRAFSTLEAMTPEDGHCRAFDAKARGSVGGSGVGLVVLKPLDLARADGDHIHAVLRGSAVNNDGGDKIGFTAPSVSGQARVIRAAHAVAEVTAETITYVEAHGTGTVLGDPVEISALTQAFRASTDARGFCLIGSAKTNIGHTDAAAGAAGFIKAVLAVEHGVIPPSLNFTEPNPEIDFATGPFRVNTELRPWTGTGPRRAGVSAFGFGGTNAHAVLEEPPTLPRQAAERPEQLLVLSAKSASALEAMTAGLAEHLAGRPEQRIDDVALTLQVGRQAHPYRRFVVCSGAEDAVRALSGSPNRTETSGPVGAGRSVAFVFSGFAPGAHAVRRLSELVEFRRHLEQACETAGQAVSADLLRVLLDDEREPKSPAHGAAAVAFEYSLARSWVRWGVKPTAVTGDRHGAFSAACFTGDLSLADAARSAADGETFADADALAQAPQPADRLLIGIGSSSGSAGDGEGALRDLLTTAGRLWLAGIELRWERMQSDGPLRRVKLPTYPFQRQRYFVEGRAAERTDHTASVQTGEILQDVTALVGQLLGIDTLDPANDLYDLGADSWTLIELCDQVQAKFGVEISLEEIQTAVTPETLARRIEERRSQATTGRRGDG